MAPLALDTPVRYAKGVGEVRARQLSELGIATLGDLLMYFPRRFDLRRQAQPIATLRGNEPAATVVGQVRDVEERRFGRRPWLACCLDDGTGYVLVKWFHGGYLRDRIKPGLTLAISGKVSVFREVLQFINPRHEIIPDAVSETLATDELLPVYPAGAKLTSGHIAFIIRRALPEAIELVPRWFEPAYLSKRGLMDRPAAVAAMHRPEDKEQWAAARRTLAYGECLLMQLGLAMMHLREVSRPAHALPPSQEIDRRIRARFPFTLTAAQDRVIAEIVADLSRQTAMNRLLQGDVGSGKTVVALYAALLAVARGKQAAIMAPTEILASQHYDKVQAYLAGSRVRTALLVGGQGPSQRREILAGLAEGRIDIVVGTHALLGEGVRFAQLALVVVDEQHKFGVRQRTGIRGKGFAPHYLVMTATPIPRTLAMTVFGDLDVSVLDASPPGRGQTVTQCLGGERMEEVFGMVEGKLTAGQQAYFIYPLVEASAKLHLQAARQAHRDLAEGPLGRFGVGLIHGQMPPATKEAVMRDFRAGRVKVLAASVVVEVGLDIPAANVMVVMHAERFGLAQLHQLRGRIGRGSADALCILVASPNSPAARRRLETLGRTHDGFEIAEEDLRLRGPGEIFSVRQHGLPELKVADLIDDFDLLRLARRDAFDIIKEDPHLDAPHHQQLRRELLSAYGDRLDLAAGA
ncbi:MAG: ATP-dependent DNA helicase RecG [Phycisphaerae bacterium]|nr:ATP-dependent DNA helicase RecG [Phycisphaerae bacterium]